MTFKDTFKMQTVVSPCKNYFIANGSIGVLTAPVLRPQRAEQRWVEKFKFEIEKGGNMALLLDSGI